MPEYYCELTEKDKRNLYNKEILDDLSKGKLYFCSVILTVPFFDILLESAIRPLILKEEANISFPPELSLLLAAILFFVFSCIPCLRKLTGSKFHFLRIMLNSLAIIIFSIYILVIQYYEVENAIQKNTQEQWIQAHTSLSYSIYVVLIVNLVSPLYYLNILPSGAYYLGIVLAYSKVDHPQGILIVCRNLTSLAYVIIANIIASQIKWQSFLRKLEVGSWNKLYSSILDTSPSAIAILDEDGKITYSNSEFDKNCEPTPTSLFEKITDLRLRNSINPPKSPQGMVSISLHNEEVKKLLNTEDFNKKPSNRLERRNDENKPKFENLNELLLYYRECLKNHKLDNDEQIIYDSKIISIEPLEFSLSYEIIIRPLVERKKVVLILNNTTERDLILGLENSNEYKDQLLASVSHELRTPLNGNLGLLQAAINDHAVPENTKNNLLLPAYRSGKLLLHLMNDLLDYFHLLTDKLILCYESKSLKETLEYCYQLLEDGFSAKDLTFNLTIDEKLPPLFRTDHNRLTQVILNLLTNALKFTMSGNVSISVEYKEERYAEIQVKDTGIGVTQEDIQKLFDEENLRQSSVPKNKSHSKGAGLGLKVTSRLAKLLGHPENRGIQVKSKPEKGSCFSFTVLHESNICSSLRAINIVPRVTLSIPEIPLEFSDNLDPTPSHAMASLNSHKKWTFYKKKTTLISEFPQPCTATSQNQTCVLIVDDDPFNILALESQLAQLGFAVDSANNGKQALDKVSAQLNHYRLIFMDCQMPIMDGYEASRKLTHDMARGKLPKIPIVGCTAFTDKDRIAECIRCGMKQVLNKPIMKTELQKILKEYIEPL